MGLFKEFKDDFSQAVNELVPGEMPEREAEPNASAANTSRPTAENLVVDTIGENVDVESELAKLNGLLEHVDETPKSQPVVKPTPSENFAEQTIKNLQEEEQVAQMNEIPAVNNIPEVNNTIISGEVQDETSVITASTVLTGDMQSSGSFDIQGTINGNVMCNGKIVVTGTINGNTNSSEFFADVAKVEGGEMVCQVVGNNQRQKQVHTREPTGTKGHSLSRRTGCRGDVSRQQSQEQDIRR